MPGRCDAPRLQLQPSRPCRGAAACGVRALTPPHWHFLLLTPPFTALFSSKVAPGVRAAEAGCLQLQTVQARPPPPSQAQEAKATGSTEDEDAFLKRMADTADAVRRGGSEAPLSDADHQAAFAARSAVEQEVTKALDTAVPTDGEVDVYNAQVVPATARDRKRMLAEEVLRFR